MSKGRKPGGQPGNKNAVKHGYYSDAYGVAMRARFVEALEMQDWQAIHREVAVARTQLHTLIQKDVTNHEVLVRMLNTITRMIRATFGLSIQEEGELGEAMRTMLAAIIAPDADEGTEPWT